MSRVLVTGGAGFIGSHVCEELLRKGYEVRVLDNLSQGKREWIPADAEFIFDDIKDLAVCQEAMKGVSGVFHLAAMSRVLPSLGQPVKNLAVLDDNVAGTVNVLIAAQKAKVKKVVYSGSSTYYGNQPPPHKETLPPDCSTPYALSKHIGEQYCDLFYRMYGLPTLTLRYFQVYGPRQPKQGTYAMVTGIFADQKKSGLPLTIEGDGSQRRDFVHVRDVASANVRAFESGAVGTIINIGTGESYSVKELADMISPNQTHKPAREHDLKETKADIQRCAELLNWKPEIDFKEGLAELLAL